MMSKGFLTFVLLAILPMYIDGATNATQTAILASLSSSLPSSLGFYSAWVGDPCQDHWPGVTCNTSSGNIIGLTLMENGLSGPFPSSLLQLDTLQNLDLSLNQGIVGPVPAGISALSSLSSLFLYGCSLNGSLPPTLTALTSLVVFDVHNNSFTGELPSLESLSQLYYFDVSLNLITGPAPLFANRGPLGHMHLQDNQFTQFNGQSLSRYPSLVHVLMSNNRLNQILNLADSNSLLVLDFSHNVVLDDLFGFGHKFPNLTSLTLQNCHLLQQPLPDLSPMKRLSSLDLSFNNFTGTLPNWLAVSLPSLITVNLGHNRLVGPFPQNFASADSSGRTNMQAILLQDNFLSGAVPFLAPADASLPLLLALYDNLFTSASAETLAENNGSLLLYGNNFCVPFRPEVVVVCAPPSALPVYKPAAVCPNLTCPLLNQPAPVALTGGHCLCSSPALATIYFSACPFLTFSAQLAEQMAANIADGLGMSVSASQVSVLSITTPPPNTTAFYITAQLAFFPSPADGAWTTAELGQLQAKLGAMGSVSDFGPFHVSSFQYPAPTASSSSLSTGAIVGIAVAAAVALLALLALLWLLLVRRRAPRDEWTTEDEEELGRIKVHGCRLFRLGELQEATQGFQAERQLGRGGYGTVYLGTLPSGEQVAVKRAKPEMRQRGKEFKTEIELMSGVRHTNAVALLGFCRQKGEQLLVYEYVAQGTLKELLTVAEGRQPLSWEQRLRICVGAANALAYLHYEISPPIVHRDIKASNILVTDTFEAKVADFGISKQVEELEIVTAVRGTPGYLDPEYLRSNILTEKSDVFSFGVVLLEVATGLRPIVDSQPLREFVAVQVNSGGISTVLDPALRQAPPHPGIFEHFLRLGMHCTAERAHKRPDMRAVQAELQLMYAASMGQGQESDSDVFAVGSSTGVDSRDSTPAVTHSG